MHKCTICLQLDWAEVEPLKWLIIIIYYYVIKLLFQSLRCVTIRSQVKIRFAMLLHPYDCIFIIFCLKNVLWKWPFHYWTISNALLSVKQNKHDQRFNYAINIYCKVYRLNKCIEKSSWISDCIIQVYRNVKTAPEESF